MNFHNKPISDNTHAKFRQNRIIFVFWCPQWSTVVQKVSKNKNCPILTKFGVCIVWSGLVIKIKKNFEKSHFLDRFLSWSAHCARFQSEILIFFSRLQNIYMLGISKKSEVALGMFILLLSLKMRVTVTPMCTVRRPKIFWLMNPLHKGVQWRKS